MTAGQLLDATSTARDVTEAGGGNDVRVGVQHLESSWPGGGAVAIFDLMEDAATAETGRWQVGQRVHRGVSTEDGTPITADCVPQVEDEELENVEAAVGDDVYARGRVAEARGLFGQVALDDDVVELLTLPADQRSA